VFATAFYLVGFGYYAVDTLAELGVAVGDGLVIPLALLFGAGFTVLNVTERKTRRSCRTGSSLLLSILVFFLGYGGLDAVGLIGEPSAPEQFAPFGTVSVLTTAALVFTSYLGFAQVATVAGEMKNPGRNLPLAMVGSVLVVGVLYVAAIFVATSAFGGSEQLAGFGETAMVEVGRHYLGAAGAFAIVFGGLLATMSSANASVLSTSRAIYAVSKDALLPRRASHINLRYGTPHVALGMAGGPISCWSRPAA